MSFPKKKEMNSFDFYFFWKKKLTNFHSDQSAILDFLRSLTVMDGKESTEYYRALSVRDRAHIAQLLKSLVRSLGEIGPEEELLKLLCAWSPERDA